MKKSMTIGLVCNAFFILVATLFVVNAFIYPLISASPNYNDVSRVFNRFKKPADWREVSLYEVRGIAGRQCPIEGDGCFSKGKRFSVQEKPSEKDIKSLLADFGCTTSSYSETIVVDSDIRADYSCGVDGLLVSGSLFKSGSIWEVSFYVASR